MKVLQCSKTITIHSTSCQLCVFVCLDGACRKRCWVWVNEGGGAPPPLRRGVGVPPPPYSPPKLSNTPRGHTLAGGGPRGTMGCDPCTYIFLWLHICLSAAYTRARNKFTHFAHFAMRKTLFSKLVKALY